MEIEKNTKEKYVTPEISVSVFAGADVVTGSNDGEWDTD